MLDAIRSFFASHAAPSVSAVPAGADRPDPVHVAACALMLELAHADQEFTDEEQGHIREALERHFALPAETARRLMALAEQERRQAVDLYQFTSLIVEHYDEGQRMVLAEVLWRLVYSDGRLARHEDHLMRKLACLLDLKPAYLAEARQRAARAD